MIKIYRKTDTIKAEQFDGSDTMVKKYHVEYDEAYILPFRIETLDGWLGMKTGDWVIDVDGEHWPIDDDEFKRTHAELPVIPQVWADTIEEYKANHYRMDEIFTEWSWNYDEQELIARAWLDGYQIETKS